MARKILLADDSVTAQNMGRKILMEAGYEVTTVNNGSAALKKIAEQKPDLIILDVYMPGYGGLEVCQRLKENQETARIPVLLTVGKLEPFKVEEARRVRADMHIVKPFEVNELLTALAKLEDRIVAQSDAPKVGRFAKAAEPPPEADFGDAQGGWKSRLTMPRRKAKAAEPRHEAQLEAEAIAKPADEDRAKASPQDAPAKPKRKRSRFEEVPADITPEEVSAIVSAASTFRDLPDPRPAHEVAANTPVSLEDKPPETQAETRNLGAHAEPKLESAANVVATVPAQEVPTDDLSAANPVEVIAESKIGEQPPPAAADGSLKPDPKRGDEEVTAALDFLIPSSESAGNNPAAERDRQLAAATAEHATAQAFSGQQFSGPRWIAQGMAVTDEESTSILEQEMEKAYAAFAAAEAGRMSFAMGPLEALSFRSPTVIATGASVAQGIEPAFLEEHVPEVHQYAHYAAMESRGFAPEPAVSQPAVPEHAQKFVQEEASQESFAPQAAAQPAVPQASEESEQALKSHDLDLPKAPEAAAQAVENQPEASPAKDTAVMWVSSPAPFREAANEPPVEATVEVKEEVAAFAAAASGGPAEAVASQESKSKENKGKDESPSSEQKGAELMAAWQSWRQIREEPVGVTGRESQPADGENPASDRWQACTQPDSVSAEPLVAAENAENETDEISSLVDTMLAELKPKLMKEIAAKMAKGKK